MHRTSRSRFSHPQLLPHSSPLPRKMLGGCAGAYSPLEPIFVSRLTWISARVKLIRYPAAKPARRVRAYFCTSRENVDLNDRYTPNGRSVVVRLPHRQFAFHSSSGDPQRMSRDRGVLHPATFSLTNRDRAAISVCMK